MLRDFFFKFLSMSNLKIIEFTKIVSLFDRLIAVFPAQFKRKTFKNLRI